MSGAGSSARFLAARLARIAVIVALVAVLAFALVSLAPIDPVQAYLGPNALKIGPEQRALIAERWGLGEPLARRFLLWAGHALGGDLGLSPMFNEPVARVIAKRFQASIALLAVAWVLSGVIGFTLGLIAGTWSCSIADRLIRVCAYTLAATPTFWIAMLLLMLFSVALGWAPICCAAPIGMTPDQISFGDRLAHLALPAAALSLLGVAQITLHTRQKLMDLMSGDVAVYAFAQGASRWDVAWRQGARHAALPAITLLFASVGELFGGSLLAEQVFTYPGLGQATVEAGLRGDVPLLLGIAVFSALFVSLGNLLADGLQRLLDPRLKGIA